MRTVGNPERFAVAFDLRPDPDEGRAGDLRASWGALQIWVGGRNLTAGRAGDDTSVNEAEVPLAPVLRWLVEHWDPLFHEERLPRLSRSASAAAWRMNCLASLSEDESEADALLRDRESWWKRHGFGAALPDFRIPDLHIRRQGSEVEVSWDDREWRSVPRGVVLLEPPGAAWLPATEVAEVLFGWARALTDELAAQEEAADFAAEMSAALEGLRGTPSHLRRLRWAAGQDLERAAIELRRLAGVAHGTVEETVRSFLELPATREPPVGLVSRLTVPALLYRSSQPSLTAADLAELLRFTRDLPEDEGRLEPFRVRERPPSSLEAITQDGLDKALELRRTAGIPEDVPLTGERDLESWLREELCIRVEDIRLDDTHVDGAAAHTPGRAPLIAVNKSGRFSSRTWGRRMTLAHELCHLLHDFGTDGEVGIVSNPWAPYALERRANAFAAMLLVPERLLQTLLPRDPDQWTPGLLRDAMARFGVGRSTLTWQLYNLNWITASEREAWLDEL